MQVPMLRRVALWFLFALSVVGVLPGALGAPRADAVQPAQVNGSYWGMNAYLSKLERRNRDNVPLLAQLTKTAGVQWTREEITWVHIEPNNNDFRGVYDADMKLIADNGFNIIGVLMTTPAWARDAACSGDYWCPPANVNEYAQFAGWMAERYDGDGVNDAPGSPRIAAWQIWNEPNAEMTWRTVGNAANTRRRYGEMMVAAYNAIKAANPGAIVLTGGVYVFDGASCPAGNCDGLVFLDGVFAQVPAAKRAFDVFAIHPQLPTAAPDSPNLLRLVTLQGRVDNALGRLRNGWGRTDAPLWITELGWCTATGACPGGVQVSEEQQANYLVRAMVIAQQQGAQHTNWLQLEDAFNDSNREWSNTAIVRNYDGANYAPKPAYNAYRTLATTIGNAAPAGRGPVHTQVFDPTQPYGKAGGTYDYRYVRGSTIIDVLWRPNDTANVSFPLTPGRQITLVQRDGQSTPLPNNGAVNLTLSEKPIIIVQSEASKLVVSPNPLVFLAQNGGTARGLLLISNASGSPLNWSASTQTPWLQLSAASGTTPSSVVITANTGGLGVGTYNGNITVASSAGTITMPVTLRVVTRLDRNFLPLSSR